MTPDFSIIIPTFNVAPKLDATLDSVAAQSGVSLEILVMDGASTDGTPEILRQYAGQQNIHFHSQRDDGVYDAMNRGIARARGRYLYFLGAGDTLVPDILSIVEKQLPPHDLGFVYGNVRFGDGQIFAGKTSRLKMRRRNICHQAVFYGREIFARLGDYDLKYPILSDYAFNLRCFGDDEIPKIWTGLVIANFEGGGLSSRPDAAFLEDRLELLRALGQPAHALSVLESKIPSGLKEWRYQSWRRLRARFGRP